MNASRSSSGRRGGREQGYLVVLFVLIVAFVGVVLGMQVLVLTSVATTSRAYDGYRQGIHEMDRLERVVAETLLDEREISVPTQAIRTEDALARHLTDLGVAASVSPVTLPAQLPEIITYPNSMANADPLGPTPADMDEFLSPQLLSIAGQHMATYPEVDFDFACARTALDGPRTYPVRVRARFVAVPLSRYPVAAYELPADIGATIGPATSGPDSSLPAGIVPVRDTAFVTDLQSSKGILPYHYRGRTVLAAAYQYVFSQAFIDRVAEYAGITHYCDLAVSNGTAALAGMTKSGAVATWDLALAGNGTYNTITLARDAAVVFTEAAGYTLRLQDSAGNSDASPMCLLALGPSKTALGPLVVDIGTIARPVIIIGYNVRITGAAGSSINGALFLDTASAAATSGPISVGHLSYWAGSPSIPSTAISATGIMPNAAEAMSPRVVYVATAATRI